MNMFLEHEFSNLRRLRILRGLESIKFAYILVISMLI